MFQSGTGALFILRRSRGQEAFGTNAQPAPGGAVSGGLGENPLTSKIAPGKTGALLATLRLTLKRHGKTVLFNGSIASYNERKLDFKRIFIKDVRR